VTATRNIICSCLPSSSLNFPCSSLLSPLLCIQILAILVQIDIHRHIFLFYCLGYYTGIRFRCVSSSIASYSLHKIPKGKDAIAHAIAVNLLPWLISFGGGCRNRGGVQARTPSSLSGGADGLFMEGYS
jgi:hypothetical protein